MRRDADVQESSLIKRIRRQANDGPTKKECKENPALDGCKRQAGGQNGPTKKECKENPALDGCKRQANGKQNPCQKDPESEKCEKFCKNNPKHPDCPTDRSAMPNGLSGGISNNLYEQLWCSDLAFEQALQQCVENKINP